MDTTPAPIRKYLLTFTALFIFTLLAQALLILVDSHRVSLGFVAFPASVFVAAAHFAQDRNRMPSTDERMRFAFGSILISFVVMGAGYLLMASQPGTATKMDALHALWQSRSELVVFAIICVAGIEFAIAYFVFPWFAGKTLKLIARKEAASGHDRE